MTGVWIVVGVVAVLYTVLIFVVAGAGARLRDRQSPAGGVAAIPPGSSAAPSGPTPERAP